MTLSDLKIVLATYPERQKNLTVLIEIPGKSGPVYLRLAGDRGAAKATKTVADGRERITLEPLTEETEPNVVVLAAHVRK